MSLITACEIFCNLKFHVVCACTFMGNTICFVKMIKIVTLIDLHIVLTNDCWHCFSVKFNDISVNHVLEMTINFYYPTLELFCFALCFSLVFCFFLFFILFLFFIFSPNLILTQNFVYPTFFSSVLPPAINNDRSLSNIKRLIFTQINPPQDRNGKESYIVLKSHIYSSFI